MTLRLFLFGSLMLFGACSTRGDGDGSDAGTGPRRDAAAAEDAGFDAGAIEADAAVGDAAVMDASVGDAGVPDAEVPDAEVPDAEVPDAGVGDAGAGTCALGECGLESYCDLGAACGDPGVCRPRPEFCTGDCPGVCGCDGRTYCNECGANAMGIAVDGTGMACETGSCAAMDANGAGECDLVLGAVWDGTQCRDVSGCRCVGTDCSELFETFEECQVTYADCLATRECGGRSGETCGRSEWCDQTHCGRIDEVGTCEPRPVACPEILDPVCGCDGRTYDNGCLANSHGIDVSTMGPCEE